MNPNRDVSLKTAAEKKVIPFVDLKTQYHSIQAEIQSAISRVLDTSQFILGTEVADFEHAFAQFCGAKYAIGVNSGTSALYLALLALGVGPGDEVITVAQTFIATAEAISWTGARPVFVDIDEKTYTMDPEKFKKATTKKTKAVIPVHLYGHPADMDPILEVANKKNLFVIEDAAQAHGALYKGRRVGSLGRLACFSFYPGKNLGAYGEGGGITTNDSKLAILIQKLRNHGRLEKGLHECLGLNARLEGIQGAILKVKLPYLEQWNRLRRQHAELYSKLLNHPNLVLPYEAGYAKSAYHLYVIRSRKRDRLVAYLNEQGILAQVHYAIPVHLNPPYRKLGYSRGSLPVTEAVCHEILSLPLYPELTEEQIKFISETVLEFEGNHKGR